MSRKDDAWNAIFQHLNMSEEIETRGSAVITATQIKEITRDAEGVGQQEPRNLTKFDTRDSRPRALRDSNATILATNNGTYSIFRGDGYHDVEEIAGVSRYVSDKVDSLETFPENLTTESQVIDAACASGLLADFLNDEELALTIRGRARSGTFEFNFDEHSVNVDGVQIEVDAGYEGNRIYLIEAKMGARDNFITRQLYYPYRMWQARGVAKEIVPVFIFYSDGTFYLYQYLFADQSQYNSIELVKCEAYVISTENELAPPDELRQFESREYIQTVRPTDNEASAPFPQADDVRKVIDSIFAVANGFTSKDDIANYYEFDIRQSDYYGNAARYLGFLDLQRGMFSLTDEGQAYVTSSREERRLLMIQAMVKSPTINQIINDVLTSDEIPSQEQIAEIIQQHRAEINETTARRRSHTMQKWLEWILVNTIN